MRPTLLFALIFALPATTAAAAAERPIRPGSAMVCRDIETTGSRLATSRVCMTKDQWDEQRRQTQADVAYGQSRLINPCPPNTRC
jgi:hypothetical protein